MSSTKLQRWIDLLAALLGHQRAITFDEIAREVPAYNGKEKATAKRQFERDKKDLKAFGVPIESEGDDGETDFRYRLRTADFYMPYLSVTTPRGKSTPSRVDRFGYHSLKSLSFDADELQAVAEGAARAEQLGNAPLAADVASAMRKLAYDLPVGAVSATDDTVIVPARAPADRRVLEALGDALHGRKLVRFEYRAIANDSATARTVEPYGLFFLNAHWYLVARDVDRAALRNFRVNRIRGVKQTAPDREVPEYEIPGSFVLRDHARSRLAWELGDSEVVSVTVEFRGSSGAVTAAAALGSPVADAPTHRRFAVRRPDRFVWWLLSFAGEAIPLGPPEIIAQFRQVLETTRKLYDGSLAESRVDA